MPARRESKRATVRQVAKSAGVSVATVSRVFSNSRPVSPPSRKKVLAAAAELGYSPDITAQNLATGQSRTVGVVVPDLAEPPFTALVRRLVHASSADSYEVLVADSDGSAEAEHALAVKLLRRCDGLVLCSPRSDAARLASLSGLGKPVLFVNREFPTGGISTATTEVAPAMGEIARHVIGLGHRRIAYAGGGARSGQDLEKLAAIREAAAGSAEVLPLPVESPAPSWTDIARKLLSWECTAVLAANDVIAVSLISALTRMGVAVPDDVSISGFDDTELAGQFTPALTTARTRTDELADAAWEAMREMLADPSVVARPRLTATAVIRESTGARRVTAP
jgi:LacI family transcriptional regulator